MNGPGPRNCSILIVDDEEGIRIALGNLFRSAGYDVALAESAASALKSLHSRPPDAALLDIRLGGDDGISLLKAMRKVIPDLVIIMITGHGSIDSSVRAMKEGASDYILKPLDNTTILEAVSRNLELRALRSENLYLKSEIRQNQDIRSIETTNPSMLEVVSIADRVKNTPASVLITGESGSGKELLARYIHFTGNRRKGNFVGVNCAALSESLLLSELFGHEKGAFTGAVEQRPGKFEMAHRGTLFLDEIGDMSPEIQAKILRVLEERSFERVGGIRQISVDVRVIAATNRNLEELIREGRFRSDLYYRLKVISCRIPPLRDRLDDLPMLVDHFIDHFNERYGKSVRQLAPGLLDGMRKHRWPGNIRELRNVVNQAVLLSESETISSLSFPVIDSAPDDSREEGVRDFSNQYSGKEISLPEAVNQFTGEFEADLIREALIRNHGNKTRTAAVLGISRKTLSRKLERYHL